MVVMVPMGPERWGPDSEEWVIHLNYPVDDPRAQSDEQVEADVRNALGLADVPMEIHKITRWSVDAVLASSFRVGRVFLRRRCRPPAPSHRRSRADECHPRRAEPLLEARRGPRRARLARAARHLRAGAAPVRRAQRQRSLENAVNHFEIVGRPWRLATSTRRGELGEPAPDLERPARRRRAPQQGPAGDRGCSRWSSTS